MKKTIRLTESQLKHIIKESAINYLNEDFDNLPSTSDYSNAADFRKAMQPISNKWLEDDKIQKQKELLDKRAEQMAIKVDNIIDYYNHNEECEITDNSDGTKLLSVRFYSPEITDSDYGKDIEAIKDYSIETDMLFNRLDKMGFDNDGDESSITFTKVIS